VAVPGLVDLSDLASEADGVAKIVLESIQELLLKLALNPNSMRQTGAGIPCLEFLGTQKS
jgi:hypothetical protein